MDFDQLPEFPARFAEPLKRALRGERAEWPAEVSPDERAIMQAHGVLPLVRRMSGLVSRDEAVHDAAVEGLRLVDLREVVAALGRHDVRPLIVKGTALAYSVYPSPELRQRVDVDLLVDRSETGKARQAFEELGFERLPTSGDELGVRQESFVRHDGFGARHVYDVHFDVTNNAVTAGSLAYGELFDRRQPAEPIGPEAAIPSNVDSLLYACIHRSVHHHDSERLLWLYDVHLLREQMNRDQHAEFWRRAHDRKVVALCRRTIQLTEAWFGVRSGCAAEDFLVPGEIDRREPSSAFLVAGRSRGSVLANDLAALPGWRERTQRLWQLAFPPPEFMMRNGARSRLVLPWLYGVRAVRGVARLLGRVKTG